MALYTDSIFITDDNFVIQRSLFDPLRPTVRRHQIWAERRHQTSLKEEICFRVFFDIMHSNFVLTTHFICKLCHRKISKSEKALQCDVLALISFRDTRDKVHEMSHASERSWLSKDVCLSVCHTPLKHFRPSGSPIILVLKSLARCLIPRLTPSAGRKIHGSEKIL